LHTESGNRLLRCVGRVQQCEVVLIARIRAHYIRDGHQRFSKHVHRDTSRHKYIAKIGVQT
jgi:hypothetical protein